MNPIPILPRLQWAYAGHYTLPPFQRFCSSVISLQPLAFRGILLLSNLMVETYPYIINNMEEVRESFQVPSYHHCDLFRAYHSTEVLFDASVRLQKPTENYLSLYLVAPGFATYAWAEPKHTCVGFAHTQKALPKFTRLIHYDGFLMLIVEFITPQFSFPVYLQLESVWTGYEDRACTLPSFDQKFKCFYPSFIPQISQV